MLRKMNAEYSPGRNAARVATQFRTGSKAPAFAAHLLIYGWPLVILAVLFLTDETTESVITSLHSPACKILFSIAKPFGRAGIVAIIAIALWVGGKLSKKVKWQRVGILIVGSVLLSSVLVAVAKPIFGRMEYQQHLHHHHEQSHSNRGWLQETENRWGRFPSGDTTMAFATATILALAFPEVAALFYIVAATVAAGRVYDNAHLLSDVFAGAWLGWAVARFFALRFSLTGKS